MKLSLIIPVYNVELYVEQCLRSCEHQNISKKDYEIIVVNDGTKDNSLKIVENVASEYNNIHIYSQENAGLSVARNIGLNYARGEYVWFIDSDDWIKENCLKEIINICDSKNLDALIIGSGNVNIRDDINMKILQIRNIFNIRDVVIGKNVLLNHKYSYCAPFTIYKRQFLIQNKLYFYPGIFHEDTEFTHRAYYYAHRIGYLNKILYYVYQNPTSITRSENPKKSFDLLLVSSSLSNFSLNVHKRYKIIYHNVIAECINNALYNIINHDKDIQDQFNLKLYKNKGLIDHLLHSTNMKYKIEGILFKLIPGHYISIYKMLQYYRLRSRK